MRANRRLLFILGTIGFWTVLTYFVIIKNHEDQNGKSKLQEKVQELQKEIQEESAHRDQLKRQYRQIIKILDAGAADKTSTSAPSQEGLQENPDVADEEQNEQSEMSTHYNNKIEFSGKYINDDVNRPVIPVVVFACNRVSVKRNLDELIKYRPNAEQFPIIVSQVTFS